MAENVYEGMFILDSNRFGRDPEGISGRVTKIIEEAGGRLLVSRLWEERRLAYAIKGHRKGAYWLTYFHLEGTKLAEVERNCQLDDAIFRVMFLKVDPRIVDTLIAHATGDRKAKEAEVAKKPKGEPVPTTAATTAAKADEPGNADDSNEKNDSNEES